VNSRLAELDRFYHRRMALSFPLAGSLLFVFLALAPPAVLIAPDLRIAKQGPLEVLPELDIIPDEESEQHLTAAPPTSRPTDFVAVDLDYATDPTAPPRPIPTPAPVPEAPEDVEIQEISELQDVQQAVLTTGHPVLAQADYEVIRWERPVYPREAVLAGIEGEVEVMMLVDVTAG